MDALELIVDQGQTAHAGRFFTMGADLIAVLDELSELPIAWRIEDLRMSSAQARIAPPEGKPAYGHHLRRVYESLVAVEEGNGLPEDWTPDAVRGARHLIERGLPAEDDVKWIAPKLALVSDGNRLDTVVDLTPRLAMRLAEIQPFDRQMPGSVRGTVVGVNVSRGNRASLQLPNKRIVRVRFDPALRGVLKDAMYSAVEMRGTIKQDADGRVFHLAADEIDILTKPEVRWTDLFGMDPTFTGGMPVEEFLEASRGEA